MVHSSIDSILDASTIDAIRLSSTATCEILDPEAEERHPVTLAPPRELASEQLSKLKQMLLDPRSWFFAKKRCLPRSAALFRLHSKNCYVTVTIDRPCVGWIVTGPNGRWGGFFDPVQDQVWTMVKELFPEYASPSRRSMRRVQSPSCGPLVNQAKAAVHFNLLRCGTLRPRRDVSGYLAFAREAGRLELYRLMQGRP
ncbi:MAG: hypothetical protein U0744_10935 [Gemmataceae bacterium]